MSIILIRINISNVKSHVKFSKREFKREEIHMWFSNSQLNLT